MTEPRSPVPASANSTASGTWVVLPTYNEAENLRPVGEAILAALPNAHLLVVDDASPDGTGIVADAMAAADRRVSVLHRQRKEGLGPAYLAGFRTALAGGASLVVQMDADGSHDPGDLPRLVAPILADEADLVIGSRYVAGGRVENWALWRRLVSRGGSLYARGILGLPVRDLTGGFKAWRASTLAAIGFGGIHAGGYVFQIEMTYRAHRLGARVREIPIVFRERRAGRSKMNRRIVAEALVVVLRLRWDELTGRWTGRGAA